MVQKKLWARLVAVVVPALLLLPTALAGPASAVTPTLSINDVSTPEGQCCTHNLVFAVTLSAASTSNVTVNYATANGTATAGTDYNATSGSLLFSPGQTSQNVNVPIIGDKKFEPNETFKVNLSTPYHATILKGTGTGTIVNDDTLSELSLTDTDSVDPVLLNTNFFYTLAAKNNGPDPAPAVKIVDTLPPSVNFISASVGCVFGSGVVTCKDPVALANGATYQVLITVRPKSIGNIANTATTSSGSTDPAPLNNTAAQGTLVNPPQAELQVTQTTDTPQMLNGFFPFPTPGVFLECTKAAAAPLTGIWDVAGNLGGPPVDQLCDLTETITVKNNGPQAAKNVSLAVNMPAVPVEADPFTVPAQAVVTVPDSTSPTPPNCTVTPGALGTFSPTASASTSDSVDCNLGTIANGASQVVTVTWEVYGPLCTNSFLPFGLTNPPAYVSTATASSSVLDPFQLDNQALAASQPTCVNDSFFLLLA